MRTPQPAARSAGSAAPRATDPAGDLASSLVAWFDANRRDLPWRRPGTSPWAVLVSEVMLQQTPVVRVVPAYLAWLARWPEPSALAAAPPGDAVRMWAKLGYPRRALRLHACAVVISNEYGGRVPDDLESLLALPGVGAYTARAVLAFAHRRRAAVVDTNVRRVLARLVDGTAAAGPPSTARDLRAMETLLPADDESAARMCAAAMELGATVCTATNPRCGRCPVAERCGWRQAGQPAYDGPPIRPQRFLGTDRQVRGRLLDVLRASDEPVFGAALDLSWPDPVQRARALDALISDGLVDPLPDGRYALPS